MFKDIKVIFGTLTKKETFHLSILSIVLLITTFADFISIGSLIFFLNSILENNFENRIYDFFKFVNSKTFEINFILFCGIVIIIFFIIKNLLQLFFAVFAVGFNSNLKLKLSKKIFEYYLNQDAQFFYKKDTSEYVRNINEETNIFTGFIRFKIEYINQIINIIFITLLASLYDLRVTIIMSLFFILFYFLYFIFFKKILLWLSELRLRLSKKALMILTTTFIGFKDVKIFNLGNYFINEYRLIDKIKIKMSIKKTVIGALPKHIMEIAIISIVFFILFFGLPANFNNEILIGRISYLITFLIIASRIYPSVSSIARLKGQLEYTRSSLKFFDKVKHIFNKKYLKKELNIQTINKSFEIKNLNFFFNKNCIFKDANLKVHRKDFIYIDGKNGSGKTTLFDILVGIISLNGKQNGQFLIDKKKLTLNQDSNPFASYAAQDPLIFNQTIRDNITLNYPFDKKELLEILKMSCLFDVINKYPKGLNTILGEGGIKLSKGNIQRVALARALLYLKNTTHKVLILDEATSAIDSQSEKKIFKNLKKSNLYDLLFYTSHNLSNQKYANKKFTIKNNKIYKKL